MTKKKKTKNPWVVLIALILSVFVGASISPQTPFIYGAVDLVGTLFLNALTLVVVPLVASSIILGVTRFASESQFGRVGLKTFVAFALTNLLAIVIGVCVINLVKPGVGLALPSQISTPETLAIAQNGFFSKLILEIIPPNILAAFAKGNMLGLVFFSVLFGYAITHVKRENMQTHRQFWKGAFQATLQIVHAIMWLLPLGVFCLATKTFADLGLEALKPLAHFVWVTLLAFALYSFAVVPLLLKFQAKVSIRKYYRAIAPAVVTAFSTGSSSATLPISLDCMEERAGVSNRISFLVIPLGTTLNLSGTALYQAMAGVFIAQIFGIELTALSQIALVIVSFFIAFGVAAIPGGGMIAMVTLLGVMGLPLEGIGLLVALDRLIDMFRTTTNLFSYTTCTTLVAKSEGEKNILTKTSYPI